MQNMGTKTMLVTDPPFGGRTELITATLDAISGEHRRLTGAATADLPIFWVYPYFMETQIGHSKAGLRMLDYKVEYENHASFGDGSKGRKQGSPVRVFTNVDPRLIKLPPSEYKHCAACDKWVAKENKHCTECDDCTSKSGIPYVHCHLCARCVKSTWRHCDKCNRCAQKEHTCRQLVFLKECFNCKEPGHKRVDCPKNSDILSKKRAKLPKHKPKKKRKQ